MRMNRKHLFPTHLLYADDILIFYKATMQNARAIRDIFLYYGVISGQDCSREKSQLFFAKGILLCYQRQISRALGFSVKKLPTVYLGVPLFAGSPRAVHLAAIKDKIINKFSRWKGMQLSMAGRLCLVKSIIQSSLVHTMMIYKWPGSLIKDLDKACRNFIWSGDINKKPSFMVSWDRVCGIKEERGLGVRSFDMINEAFLMKLAWNVIKGKKFGYDILHSRYLDEFGRSRETLLASLVWGWIKQLVLELIADSYCLLGSGSSVYFWDDDWLGYSIANKIGIPTFLPSRLKHTMIWALWSARNKCHFDGIYLLGRAVLAFIKSSFVEVDSSSTKMGHISNISSDYMVARRIGVTVRIRPPPNLDSVYWSPSAYSWLKANTDGSAVGAPGQINVGGVFCD
ncbi:uncharacterized protein LOC130994327 [Salvia miltiorrhiza]|uniref:uncharacterized protein LOC130994327 n=1 Tax=Salvia miltiorrhiza TaxID=226208 RepID=UPI0025ACD5AE|nr:uncharacterized protein LOC130994327 [Salvia miltiorrhiza]